MLTKAPKTKHRTRRKHPPEPRHSDEKARSHNEQLVAAAQSFWWALWSRAQVDDDIAAEQYAEQYRFAKRRETGKE